MTTEEGTAEEGAAVSEHNVVAELADDGQEQQAAEVNYTPAQRATYTQTILGATLGFAKVDIVQVHENFKFGTWNTRALEDKKVKDLVQSMELEGVQWFRADALLPFMVRAAYIELASTTKDLTLGAKMPTLTLTLEGLDNLHKWVMASGQHRVRAVLEFRAGKAKRAQTIQKALKRVNEKTKEGYEKAIDLRMELRIVESEIRSAQHWGVQVIDEG